MKLSEVIPWGRSFDEYQRMFALTASDLTLPLLGCGDGPASFNAELTRRGGRVISADPLYDFTAAQIRQRIDEVVPTVIKGVKQSADAYVWTEFQSPEELVQSRLATMANFLEDFEQGKAEGRYRVESLPHLSFGAQQFALVLCSHLLFTYSDLLDELFHEQSLREMLRVAQEVRVFPILNIDGQASPHLAPLLARFKAEGYQCSVEKVSFEFQKGGCEMLRIRAL